MHNLMSSRSGRLSVLIVLLAMVSAFYMSCNEKTDTTVGPSAQQRETVLNKDNPRIKDVMAIQERHTDELMHNPEITGTAVGLKENGTPCIIVMAVSDVNAAARARGNKPPVPEAIENIPTRLEVTGEFRAFRSGKAPLSHTVQQKAPISLGTSGGWRNDIANGYCCSGTLGALVTDGTNQYILSNYHVFYSDIVSGGNNIVAKAGDNVIQPGLVDAFCDADNAQNVAVLIDPAIGGSLPSGNVDAGIAQVLPGMVDPSGTILEIGKISKSTLEAAINQKVKKSGRTTGLSRSIIKGLNATVRIKYEAECSGRTAFIKKFTKQIVIDNPSGSFLNSGDSGSLMVENVSANPRAVGLLFAGSSTTAIASSITDVLSFYWNKTGRTFTMVGN